MSSLKDLSVKALVLNTTCEGCGMIRLTAVSPVFHFTLTCLAVWTIPIRMCFFQNLDPRSLLDQHSAYLKYGELEYADDDIMLERWLIAMSARFFFFRLLSSIPNSLPISSCSSKHDLAVYSLPRVPLLCPSHHASSATFFSPAWRDTWSPLLPDLSKNPLHLLQLQSVFGLRRCGS